jgi:acetyl-CoA carboxylase carboxyltransferase component
VPGLGTTVFDMAERRQHNRRADSPSQRDTAKPAHLQTDPRAALQAHLAFHARRSAGVVVATSDLDGRLDNDRTVVTFTADATDTYLGLDDGLAMAAAADAARTYGHPLVGILQSRGNDVHEGLGALHGWGVAARALSHCSGVVPIALIVDGPLVSGPALLLGLADFVVMTDSAYSFVNGPSMVANFTGLSVDNASLGGADTHAKTSGLATRTAESLDVALDHVAELLSFLPDHVDVESTFKYTDDPIDRDADELDSLIPTVSTGSYDVRNAVTAVADDGIFCEIKARWAPNLCVGFAHVAGRAVGVVANQPMSLAGTLDINAAQKGAWFVSLCDSFNLPIVTFVDTPGYFPGKDLEWRGMIRHGAQMAFAYAEATVPRICIVLRKAYGGAYIVMDCKTMGNDLCIAWPSAELAVMGAKGAVQILHRREDDATRLAKELEYAGAYLNPYVAAERGYVDAVVLPHETRKWVARSVELLSAKRELLRNRRHANSPL